MACNEWNEALVARLYDELEESESRRLDEHLVACADCRDEFAALQQSREWLASAADAVPRTPRVVVLQPARVAAQPSWLSFAAGFAAAAVLLGAGLAGGWAWAVRSQPAAGTLASHQQQQDAVVDRPIPVQHAPEPTARSYVTPAQFVALQQQVDGYAGRIDQIGSTIPTDAMTVEEFQAGLEAYRQNFDAQRTAELQLIMQEIAGVEVRNSARIGQTQSALEDFVVLSGNSRVPH